MDNLTRMQRNHRPILPTGESADNCLNADPQAGGDALTTPYNCQLNFEVLSNSQRTRFQKDPRESLTTRTILKYAERHWKRPPTYKLDTYYRIRNFLVRYKNRLNRHKRYDDARAITIPSFSTVCRWLARVEPYYQLSSRAHRVSD
jgi:hypothetical protein